MTITFWSLVVCRHSKKLYLCCMRVAFTGHREAEGADSGRLVSIIRQLYSEGYTVFMSGMAEGFDLLAAQAVLSLKEELTDIKLLCVIPFEGHISKINSKNRPLYNAICASADEVITLAPEYHEKAYYERNDYLVDNADAMICYYSGKRRSGTGYTVTAALKKRIRTINIYADGEQIRFFG